jgi:hypothetical protein
MSVDRVAAVRLWAGAALFGALAARAWWPDISMMAEYVRWWLSSESSGGVGAVSYGVNTIEIGLVVLLPVVGNLLLVGEARRHPVARRLRVLHLLTWAALIVSAALIFLLPQSVAAWNFGLLLLLLPIQLTLLALVYAVLATARSRAAGAAAG